MSLFPRIDIRKRMPFSPRVKHTSARRSTFGYSLPRHDEDFVELRD